MMMVGEIKTVKHFNVLKVKWVVIPSLHSKIKLFYFLSPCIHKEHLFIKYESQRSVNELYVGF